MSLNTYQLAKRPRVSGFALGNKSITYRDEMIKNT